MFIHGEIKLFTNSNLQLPILSCSWKGNMVTWIESEKGTFFHSEIKMLKQKKRETDTGQIEIICTSLVENSFFFFGNNEQVQPALINQTHFLIVIILNPLCHWSNLLNKVYIGHIHSCLCQANYKLPYWDALLLLHPNKFLLNVTLSIRCSTLNESTCHTKDSVNISFLSSFLFSFLLFQFYFLSHFIRLCEV